MTPHLHPRSRLTTSLFGTTLLVSFLVVGMPHILPCPAPRVKFAEGDYEITEDGRRRRRRRIDISDDQPQHRQGQDVSLSHLVEEEEYLVPRKAHECPVPKPKRLIGEVLGFTTEGSAEKTPRPRIETGPRPVSKKENS